MLLGLASSTQPTILLDHLVGARQHRDRYLKAKHPRGLQVDNQLVFVGQLHRQFCRLLALENAVDVGGSALVEIDVVHSIGGKSSARRVVRESGDIGETMPM